MKFSSQLHTFFYIHTIEDLVSKVLTERTFPDEFFIDAFCARKYTSLKLYKLLSKGLHDHYKAIKTFKAKKKKLESKVYHITNFYFTGAFHYNRDLSTLCNREDYEWSNF